MRGRYLPDELGLTAIPIKQALLGIVPISAALFSVLKNVGSLGVLLLLPLGLRIGVLLV